MLKKVLIFIMFNILLVFGTELNFKVEQKCVSLHEFSKKQIDVLLYAYLYGKEHGFGYTMAAIAWQESCSGEYLLNFQDPSAGIYHALVPGVIKKYTKYKDSNFLRNIIGQMLISNPEFASSIALDELKYWQRVRKGNFKSIIKSYNKGFSWEKNHRANRIATNYYHDIDRKIKALQTFIPKKLKHYDYKTPSLELDYSIKKEAKFNPYKKDSKTPTYYLLKEK
ncbi:hypothetical protein BKH43_03060 [Helicobacter sp. 13S00401-1]|nr:hypothetical protein BKH43_03060 [Helicobacter sp. 13S00401-1]